MSLDLLEFGWQKLNHAKKADDVQPSEFTKFVEADTVCTLQAWGGNALLLIGDPAGTHKTYLLLKGQVWTRAKTEQNLREAIYAIDVDYGATLLKAETFGALDAQENDSD